MTFVNKGFHKINELKFTLSDESKYYFQHNYRRWWIQTQYSSKVVRENSEHRYFGFWTTYMLDSDFDMRTELLLHNIDRAYETVEWNADQFH